MKTLVRLGMAFAVAATVLAGLDASTVGAQPVAAGCGSVITEDTRLTRDLKDCTNGLGVAGNGITLDLGGHTISGIGTSDGGTVGVEVTGQGVTVKNGVITGFGTGVHGFASFHLQSLKVVGNGTGVGLFFAGSLFTTDSSIESSHIDGNSKYGIEVGRAGIVVANSSVRKNGSDGVLQIEATALYSNNDISQNGGNGIYASDPYTFTGGLFGNTLNDNGGSGYRFEERYLDAYPHLENNRANRNAQLGFGLFGNTGSTANLDGGGNSAKGNGDARQCVVQDQTNPIPPNTLACNKNPGGP
jgi:hypothetical protein